MTAAGRRRAFRAAAALLCVASAAGLVTAVLLAAPGTGGRIAVDPVVALAQVTTAAPAPSSAAPSPGPVAAPSVAPRPDRAWLDLIARRTGIGATALSAYASADLRMAADQPRCGLSWATLAGLGYVESRHGTIGGRTLGADGRPGLSPIFGVPLTGAGPVALVADTDDGRLDGDTRFDRAVGPLQFVPSTWRRWGGDGDGDGDADPHDLDDAAWSAARYLCASGVPLDSGTAWTGAVLSYNLSSTYVQDVLAATNAYASRSIS